MPKMSFGAYAAFSLAAKEAEDLGSIEIDLEHLFLGLCRVEVLRGQLGERVRGLDSAQLVALQNEATEFVLELDAAGVSLVRAHRRLHTLLSEGSLSRETFSGHRT